jgi:hypothetical protein
VLKNLKINRELHRKLRIKASELGCGIGQLTEILIAAALKNMKDATIRAGLSVTSHDNSRTGYRDQGSSAETDQPPNESRKKDQT